MNGLKPVEKYSLPVSPIIISLRTVKKASETRLRTVISETVLYCLSVENHISGKLGQIVIVYDEGNGFRVLRVKQVFLLTEIIIGKYIFLTLSRSENAIFAVIVH